MKMKLEFNTSSYYGTLLDKLNFLEDEAFGSMIVINHRDQNYDPLSNNSVFKLSNKGRNFLENKKLKMRESGYNRSTLGIAFCSMVIALIGLLYALGIFN